MMRTLVLSGALAVASCSTSEPEKGPGTPAPPQPAAAAAPAPPPDAGRALFVGKCATCHTLPDPASLGDVAWAKQVKVMIRQKNAKITPDEERQIVEYLMRANGRS